MGDPQAQEGDNIPAHQVSLDGFWMHQSEVTNRMYAQCVAAGVCSPPVSPPGMPSRFNDTRYQNHPVVNVTWQDAANYCEWIGGALLTEAEWEWAARGDTGHPYPWGDEDPSCSRLNFANCSLPSFTAPVLSYPLGLSPFNAADMAGNVFEWVHDWYAEDYYANSPSANPTGPDTGTERVVRSSGFRTVQSLVPATQRFSQTPDSRRDDLGFRCRLTGETVQSPPPPLCNLISYVPPPAVPGDPPIVIINEGHLGPIVDVWAFCGLNSNGDQYGSLQLDFDPHTNMDTVTIGFPSGLNCTPDAANPFRWYCTGSALHPGETTDIGICYTEFTPYDVTMDAACPPLYSLDPASGMCSYTGQSGPSTCAPPMVAVPGYGCLPPPVNGECPSGHTQAEYEGQPVCIPVCGPSCMVALTPPVCPPGLIFNESNLCCGYPPDQPPVCFPQFIYDPALSACVYELLIPPECTHVSVSIPTCAPPDEGEPEQPGPTGCWIVTTPGRPARCISPCPPGVPNQGPCTP